MDVGVICFYDDLIQKLDNEWYLLQQQSHHLMLLSTVHDPPARNVSLINLKPADLEKEREKESIFLIILNIYCSLV